MSTTPASTQNYKAAPHNRELDHIPGSYGYPLVGSSVAFMRNVLRSSRKQAARYGEVSRFQLGPDRVLIVVGADNFRTIFIDKDKNFSTEMSYKDQLGIFYAGGLLLHDFDEHRFQRRIMQSAFKYDTMRGYLPILNQLLRQHIDQWPSDQRFTFYPRIKQTLLEVGSRIFLGIEDYSGEAEVMNTAFNEINLGLTSMLRLNIPGGKLNRGLKAKRLLQGFILNQIPLRRGSNKTDMLSLMCREKDEDGDYFSDLDIVQHTAFLLFAAHDTTTSVLSHLMMYMGMYPAWQQRLHDESVRLDNPDPAFDDLDALIGADLCIHEVLRLHPPVPVMARRNIRETWLGDIRIPPHTLLYLPGSYNHRDPKYWTDPETFDPERFNLERQEHKNHSFCFHPFGGGAHKCIGMNFAKLLVKSFLHQFLLNYSFVTHQKRDPALQWIPLTKPKDNVPISITRITPATEGENHDI